MKNYNPMNMHQMPNGMSLNNMYQTTITFDDFVRYINNYPLNGHCYNNEFNKDFSNEFNLNYFNFYHALTSFHNEYMKSYVTGGLRIQEPDWYISPENFIKRLQDSILLYMEKNTRITIKRKFFNIANNKEGYELENGLFVEDGKVIKNEIYKKIISKVDKILDDEIKFVLDMNFRSIMERGKKIKTII